MTFLRIGWATPWNKVSAIAQSAAEVAMELANRGHEITILRTEKGKFCDYAARDAPGPIRHLDDFSNHDLARDFDVVVGHFGDHYGYSGALLPRLAENEIFGIMHDACIPHLLDNWVNHNDLAFRAMVKDTYGASSLPDNASTWSSLSDIAQNRPMIEWVSRRTVGAIAHATHYAERIRTSCSGPVGVIPLAFRPPDLPPPPLRWGKLAVAVIGHANANKRIDQLLLATSASYLLRANSSFRIIGDAPESERARLTDLASSLDIPAPSFTGWLSDEDLACQLRDIDVISCLRNPVLEGASASLILALSSGRPTLITNHGCYSEIPDDAALSCDPANEALDIVEHLENLLQNPEFGLDVGRRGQDFIKGRHSAARYVDGLLPFLMEVVAGRPLRQAQREMIKTLGEFGLVGEDPAVSRIAAVIGHMTIDKS